MASKTLTTGGTIDFDFIGIGSVLLRQRLRVPPNQREYSWEDKQVNELFQDLAASISKNKPSYFLGTIVLTGGKDDPVKEVADGQQRLATATILLAAIRDLLLKKKQTKRAQYLDSFLSSIVLETAELEPRLVMNVDDNDYFRHSIISSPDDPDRIETSTKRFSHERLEMASKKATAHIKLILKPFSESAQIDTLNQWVKYIEHSAQVIVLTVPDDLNAFVMFETLNDRGLKTSQADLLKNYLFSEADDRIPEAQQKWSKMVGALETLETSDISMIYLRHLASALYGATREREVFEKIKQKVSGRTNSIAFLETLSDYADDYVAIMNPSDPKWSKYGIGMRRSITTLLLLAVEQIRPLMLAVSHHFKPKETISSFRLFISWVVRIMIFGGGRGGTLDAAYSELAQKVCEGTFTTTKELAKAMESNVPTDAQFQSEFATARVSKSHLARYYLRALELANRGEKEPEFVPNDDQSEISLEHILPENPGGKWPAVKPEIAAAYYTRLGNLVLLKSTPNREFGNEPFSAKKPIFEKSTYKLTEMVKAAVSWGPDEIDSRQKKLAEIAIKTWPLRA